MIKKEEIYRKTNGGLDVFKELWEDARRVIDSGSLSKPFKRRNEKHGSCYLKQKRGRDGDYWVATDFGDDQQGHNCFDWVIREHNLQGFKEAVAWIVTNLNLSVDDIREDLNKPEKVEYEATDLPNGRVVFELREDDTFTKHELETFGDLVTQEVMTALNWHPVRWVATVKDGKMRKEWAGENYPIYARECIITDKPERKSFWKIYKPLNAAKQFRFLISGQPPRDYVHGLYELKQSYERFKRQQEQQFDSDPTNEGKTLHYEKLNGAVLACGERDCANVKALGGFPVWLNGEGGELERWQEAEILKCVDVIYNIPDKDETGLRRGMYQALRHPDIRTVWLPSWFQRYHDARHHYRKDFRDFIELVENEQKTFNTLLEQALPATFWNRTLTKSGKERYEVNSVCLLYFLRLQGFHKLRDKTTGQSQLIRLSGNIAEKVTAQDISEFLISWSRGNEPIPGYGDKLSDKQPVAIQNLIIDSPRCQPAALEKVDSIELDFCSNTPTAQYFFFKNCTVRVTADDIKPFNLKESSALPFYVWKENIIPHDFRPLPTMFRCRNHRNEETGEDEWNVELPWDSVPSKCLGYLINSSRLYWQKEMEAPFDGHDDAEALRAAYRKDHLFRITADTLSDQENQWQQQTLCNKLFAIGYFGWGFKSPSRAMACISMDWKIDEMGECNGGSGKSFFFEHMLGNLVPTFRLDGRENRLDEDKFKYSGVTQDTRIILFDDLKRDFPLERYYAAVTGSLTVNPKHLSPFVLPFEKSPKLAFTTNYVPRTFDASTDRRLLYMVSSDYYHTRGPADPQYHETRRIYDDFHKDLFGAEYTDQEWNQDFNLMLQCVQFYMQQAPTGIRIQPPMENILLRSSRQAMAEKFYDWAQEYFSPDSNRLDCMLERKPVFEDFKTNYNVKDMTANAFFRKLKAFCDYCSYCAELNPGIYCAPSKPGHIIRRTTNPDGTLGEPTEWIYIRSNREVLKKIREQNKAYEQQIEAAMTDAVDPDDDTPFM